MDSSSSVRGIFQAGVLEWVAIPVSMGFSQPRDWTYCVGGGGGRFTTEPSVKTKCVDYWEMFVGSTPMEERIRKHEWAEGEAELWPCASRSKSVFLSWEEGVRLLYTFLYIILPVMSMRSWLLLEAGMTLRKPVFFSEAIPKEDWHWGLSFGGISGSWGTMTFISRGRSEE